MAKGEGLNQRIRKREEDPDITRRARALFYVALAGFLLLAGRLYWLQLVQHEHFQTLSENNRLRLRTVRAPRGPISTGTGRRSRRRKVPSTWSARPWT